MADPVTQPGVDAVGLRARVGQLWGGDSPPAAPSPYEAAGWMVRALARATRES